MKACRILCLWVLVHLLHYTAAADLPSLVLPVTTAPIVYTIDDSGDYFTHPAVVQRFSGSRPSRCNAWWRHALC